MKRRVAVTGLGCISALGLTLEDFWQALVRGESAIKPVTLTSAEGLRLRNVAEAPAYNPLDYFDEKALMPLDRFAQFGLVAAREAIAMSHPGWSEEERARTAIVTGSCYGGKTCEDEGFRELYAEGKPRPHPMTIPRLMASAATSWIAMEHGLTGPAWTVSTACASSAHAIGQAFWMVRDGQVEMAVTGGCEAPISYGSLRAWDSLRVVSPDACRPFSAGRQGMILGEGAAMLVLEPLDRALQRGAPIYGEIVGFGMTADAHHLTQPSVDGPARAMRTAIADAGIDVSAIDTVNAHGTGTVTNDATESAALLQVFGERAHAMPIAATKSLHGHTLGAAGAIEAAATLLALHHRTLLPTAGYIGPDPDCPVRTLRSAESSDAECAISNSFAFGGLNAVLVCRRWS